MEEKKMEKQILNDNRFDIIHKRAKEIDNLSDELSEISFEKIIEIIGYGDGDARESKDVDKAVCWVDRVIMIQDNTIETLKVTLDRVSSV